MGVKVRKNYIDEARRLIPLIDEKKINDKEDWLFFESIKSRVRIEGFVTDNQIFWLRDIKDRQLEGKSKHKEENEDED